MSDTGTTLGNMYESPGWIGEILQTYYRLVLSGDMDVGSLIDFVETDIAEKMSIIHAEKELAAIQLAAYKDAGDALRKAHEWIDGRKALVNCVPLAEIIEDGLSKLPEVTDDGDR